MLRIICPKYWSFLHLTVVTNSFFHHSTHYDISIFVISSVLDILKILLYSSHSIIVQTLTYSKWLWLEFKFLQRTKELKTLNILGVVFW